MHNDSPFAVVGVFLVLLGVGVILDADWTWSGSGLIAAGLWCFWKERATQRRGEPPA
jgi:hypothetical protein